jgi:HD-GYP domain-containing protein (c-di-GMP phosphodiesterase class II)
MDGNIDALLKMDFDNWKDAGTGEAAFKELDSLPGAVLPSSPSTGDWQAVPVKNQSAPAISRSDRLAASWPQGKDYDHPAGKPLLTEVKFLGHEERTLVHKSALTKQFQVAGAKIQAIYDGFLLGEMHQSKTLIETAEALLGLLVTDPFGTLGLTLMRGNSLANYQYRHAVNTGVLAMAAATASGFSKAQVIEIGVGGMIADLGMVLVPEEVLNKAGKLSPEELGEIHRHVQQGVEMLERLTDLPNTALTIVMQHHERLAGAGYPRHLKGQAISHAARLVAIADTLGAMVHKRSHRDAMLPNEALDRVIKMGQMQFLDPNYVKALAGWLSVYPVGSAVVLQSGSIARVVAANLDDFQRPVVAVLKGADGQPLPMKQIVHINLKTMPNEKIVKGMGEAEAGFKGLEGF